MNLGKFGRPKRLKRLISFHKLPLAQRNLFESLKRREPSLWEKQTPPPSPQYQSEADEGDNNYYEENPFLPNNLETDPSIFRNNTMPATHNMSISDSILASDLNSQDDGGNDDEFIPRNDSDQTNIQDDTNHLNFVPPSPVPAIFNSGKSSIGLDGRPRSSSSNLTQRIFVSNKKLFV